MSKKKTSINPELEKAVEKLLKEVMAPGSDTDIETKLKVIDRSMKLEALKGKLSDDQWGVGLFGAEDEDSST